MSTLTGLSAVALYLVALAFLYQDLRVREKAHRTDKRVLGIGLVAGLLHLVSAWGLIASDGQYVFGIPQVSTLIFAAIALLLQISSIRKPLHNLMVGLFPLAIVAIIASLVLSARTNPVTLGAGMVSHILLSILAYSFFTIAALQAAFLAVQNYQLRHHHAASVIHRFPPLQDMEAFLFDLLWVGQTLLTLGIISGFLFVDDFGARGLPHKTFFSLLAWVVFGVLLWGRHVLGWRGNTAIKGTLTGFLFLVLGFYGSKVVIEYILS
ncbi:MAG: cytochrome c biogenesis protein CcsA [Pseudohongiellaceae bacterium]